MDGKKYNRVTLFLAELNSNSLSLVVEEEAKLMTPRTIPSAYSNLNERKKKRIYELERSSNSMELIMSQEHTYNNIKNIHFNHVSIL